MLKKSEFESNVLIIAEVGQNHQGDLSYAREYIKVFSAAGANVIKFQTRNNKYLFSEEAYNAPYSTDNAFANIYGFHREILELKLDWLPILKEDCEKYGVKFMSTPFDEPSLEALVDLNVDLIKIASFDLGNIPFIERIATTGKPVVMSIGGGKLDQVQASVEAISNYHNDYAILHCVSEYPCEYDRLGLDRIEMLSREFPGVTIGSSDHFNGILSGPVAYLKGARVFEKHVTLNRSWKGTDHSFALEAEGFRKFVRDIKRVPKMLQPKSDGELGKEKVFAKLGKSLVAYVDIPAGVEITSNYLSGRIFKSQYIPVRDSSKVIGCIAVNDIPKGAPISFEMLGRK